MEIIVPCAGLSTRFPNLRPKYLLTDYSGKLMIESAVKNIESEKINIAVLKQHDEEYGAQKKLKECFGNRVKIAIIEKPTLGPADTVYQTINQLNIDKNSSILIKDCDGFYNTESIDGNVIYTAKLSKHPKIRTASAKSYTVTNEQNIICSVVEKQIVSDNFCVGGYQFETSKFFVDSFESLKNVLNQEIFVSNIIDHLISKGVIFIQSEVENFIDVGTSDDWFEYNDRPTYFCDIDGTIIRSKFDSYQNYEPLVSNIEILKKELLRGCKIVFCTSRNKRYLDITRIMLNDLGFEKCELIMEIHHTKRVLINDYAQSNPYPSAVAVNLKRDNDNLEDYI